MATKIGDLFFDVYADVSRAAKSIDGLGEKFKNAGGEAARAIGETVANAVGLAVGATALLVGSTLSAGAAYNTLGQSASAAFTSIYADVSAAHGILQEISQLDLETPFQGKALTSTARTLAGFGFQLEDVVSTTQALAQATAAMGLGSDALHRMAIAFGQIQSRGKLAGDEARQLANYGIDAYGLLADQLGLTVAAVRELGQEGKLTADIVIPALVQSIESRFAGATQALFNTAAGQAEGLRSVMEGVGSALVEPFIGFSTGGALVEAMSLVRAELVGLVSIAEDGSFVLQGFLAPLTPILEGLASGLVNLSESFAEFLSNISDTALTDFMANLEGMGPVLAAVGSALAVMFAQAIPFIGRFVAGFNPIVVGLTVLAVSSSSVRASLVDTFTRIWEAVKPLIPGIKELVGNFLGIAEVAIPIIFDAIAEAVEELAPLVKSVIDATNGLLEVLGPTFIVLLTAAADALKIISDIIGGLPPDFVVMAGALYAFTTLLPLTTAGLITSTTAMFGTSTAASILATDLGMLVTAFAILAAAVGAYKAASAGIKGDIGYLDRDVPIYEKPFQMAGEAGFDWGSYIGDADGALDTLSRIGDVLTNPSAGSGAGSEGRSLAAQAEEVNRLLEEGKTIGDAYAGSLQGSGMSMAEFSAQARLSLPTQEAINYAMIAYRDILDAVAQSEFDAAKKRTEASDDASSFERRLAASYKIAQDGISLLDTEIDLLAELKTAAAAAWSEVDKLSRAGADAVADDFLSGLVDTAKDLTAALAEPAGALRDLDVSGALNKVQADALKVINVLSREYGMSMDQIKSYFDERGLAGVIDALGKVTEETTETVDPLVAKYASLGATADQLRDAISRLESQRTTALQAQIDQVTAGLRDAKDAAEAAREAFDAFFLGDTGGLQGAIDKLVLDIPNIGDSIEEGLIRGGPQGEAAIRQALGSAGSALGSIFQLGLEQGLSPEQIIEMLGPVYGSIQQELGGALNRISSLDWTEGFSPAAAAEIQSWFASILDPGQIAALFQNILGADSTVAGLENQLDDLQAQMSADVEFSPEQVQGALDEIHAETTVTAVITPEAAEMVFEAIQDVFNDDDLKAAVDQAVITQGIVDAAQAAEDEISLVFRSGLSFNSGELDMIARQVSAEFYAAFNDQMKQLRDQAAQASGFENYYEMQRALGPAVASAMVGGTVITTNVNNDIEVNGAQTPLATASEIVGASSAAAGSGGQYDPSRYYRPGSSSGSGASNRYI